MKGGERKATREGRTLTDEETDADTREIEPIEPVLDVDIYVASVAGAFPLEDTLSDGGNGWIVTLLDSFEGLCEVSVVLSYFWGPGDARSVGVVAGSRVVTRAMEIGIN